MLSERIGNNPVPCHGKICNLSRKSLYLIYNFTVLTAGVKSCICYRLPVDSFKLSFSALRKTKPPLRYLPISILLVCFVVVLYFCVNAVLGAPHGHLYAGIEKQTRKALRIKGCSISFRLFSFALV